MDVQQRTLIGILEIMGLQRKSSHLVFAKVIVTGIVNVDLD